MGVQAEISRENSVDYSLPFSQISEMTFKWSKVEMDLIR